MRHVMHAYIEYIERAHSRFALSAVRRRVGWGFVESLTNIYFYVLRVCSRLVRASHQRKPQPICVC